MAMHTEGAERSITVTVYLGGLEPEAVAVELYADPLDDGKPEHHVMERLRKLDEPDHGYEYAATLPGERPLGDYTPRLVPRHPLASVPIEEHRISWQR
jgi:starch phosphorylase